MSAGAFGGGELRVQLRVGEFRSGLPWNGIRRPEGKDSSPGWPSVSEPAPQAPPGRERETEKTRVIAWLRSLSPELKLFATANGTMRMRSK